MAQVVQKKLAARLHAFGVWLARSDPPDAHAHPHMPALVQHATDPAVIHAYVCGRATQCALVSHTEHLPLGALLMTCTMCGTGVGDDA